jgi:putative ABC transport system permease protein
MSLWKIAWRSIQQRAFVSMLTAISMGLGVALVVSVLVVYGVVSQSFHRGGEGYDLIIGAKGGKEQLVLNTVFYLSEPVGNIPYSLYEDLTEGKLAQYVELAIPVCMGHTYQGFRVVGTVPEMFTELKYRGDQSYEFGLTAEGKPGAGNGENFKSENPFDAVMGSIAAARTRLQVGDPLQAVHGSGEGAQVHTTRFHVVGILAPTGTPVDRAIFVNMKGFFEIHGVQAALAHTEHAAEKEHPADKGKAADKTQPGDKQHAAEHDEHEHGDEAKQITAILVCCKQPNPSRLADMLGATINKATTAQAVQPVKVIAELFENVVGKLEWILLGMAVLTVVVAGISIMVSIYNSMSDRRHEIAVMRALGARRVTVMLIILLESILLSLLGGGLGLLLGHGMIGICSPIIVDWTGVAVGLLQFQGIELYLIPALILLASAVGYLPALAAYRTDVAQSLTNTP